MPLVKYKGSAALVDQISGSRVNWNPGQVRDVSLEIGYALLATNPSFAYEAPGVLDIKGNVVPVPRIHPYYHFHGFAGDQTPDDPVFYDKATENHAIPGVHLSKSSLWSVPGYVSTLDPAVGATDSVLRIPPLNFDYSGGEKLILWMLGKWIPEGVEVAMIGDGFSITQRGWHIKVRADGRFQSVLYGQTIGYGGSGSVAPFDGKLHDFGIVLDGQNRKYCHWVDGQLDPNFGSDYIPFYGGASFDTRTMNTVNIGSAIAAPGGTAGIGTSIRGCAIVRLPVDYPTPSVEAITSTFRQLRANPGKLILGSAF